MNVLFDQDCVLFDSLDVLDTRPDATTSIERRRFHLFAPRPSFQATLAEEVSGSLIPIADIPGLKEGSGKIIAEPNKISVYGSARLVDRGPFLLCRFDFDMPGVYPLDLAAAARLRGVCSRVIKPNVPAATPTIDPYCK